MDETVTVDSPNPKEWSEREFILSSMLKQIVINNAILKARLQP